MEIKDSGTRRVFESGAVRDIQEGKGRCDLLPLDVICDIVHVTQHDKILGDISAFQRTGNYHYLMNIFAIQRLFINNYTMVLEVSKHFEDGCKKYGENNWQKGIPTHCYIDSAVRHYLKWLRGDEDEPHDRAFCWNIICCIWTCINKPELNDYMKDSPNAELGCKHREWFGDFNMHVCNKNGKECDDMVTCKERTI
jgi:hypothetical protein